MADANSVAASPFVVVGGGVAGVSCCQHLAESNPGLSITLISPKDVVKAVTTHRKITRALEEIAVEERPTYTITENYPNIKVVNDFVVEIDYRNCNVKTSRGECFCYRKLCLCTGAKPNLINFSKENILGIRDIDSVAELQNKLKSADRIIVIGNGGIALELVYELTGCEVIWAIKDDAIGNVFLDKAGAEFLLPNLSEDFTGQQRKTDTIVFKRKKYAVEREVKEGRGEESSTCMLGGALGPDWSLNVNLKGKEISAKKRNVHIEYCCEVQKILSAKDSRDIACSMLPDEFCSNKKWPQYVEFTNGRIFGTDLIVSATGVVPNSDFTIKDGGLSLSKDGGIKVDDNMRTNLPNVYAAGDVCTASWEASRHWFQMRLWTQAYQMGIYAARCMMGNMRGEETSLDFCFEMFAHATSFFGYKLCLLGKYNAQGLGSDYELLVRYSPGIEYVKVVLQDGKMMGALLLGETDLEETFENLILNGMDLSRFGENLLNADVEIDDFFD